MGSKGHVQSLNVRLLEFANKLPKLGLVPGLCGLV